MGTRGRKPSPGSVRSARGEYRGRQAKGVAPAVTPPAKLLKRPAAVAFWQDKAPPLIADGRLNTQNLDSFVMLCQYHADELDCEAMLEAEGLVIKTSKGMISHPATMLLARARRDFLRMALEFGLTPASYARLPAEKSNGQKANEDEALLRSFTG
jgi:P27 family predicted phage terminase small subunit